MITEKQLSKALVENFENFKEDLTFEEYADMIDFWADKDGDVENFENFKDLTFEEYADMLDFWVDKDGNIIVEERGMEPVDGVKKVGHVDNGDIYVY